MAQESTRTPGELAGIIPDPDAIRVHLERVEAEANLLRRLLRLALYRQREAARLIQEEKLSCLA
jgi:hypothetical protein